MLVGLTPNMETVLTFLEERLSVDRVCPSFDEIMRGVGWKSKQPIHFAILGLEERGYIQCKRDLKGNMRQRSIALLTPLCPHCGNILGGIACREVAQGEKSKITYSRSAEAAHQ